ncbi:aarF domain-containing protein kinase 1 [Seminavis robusta]|uniref:AarF domain-containing protein kinase 1 n=1 Tax=Seminavis robusta TaxID=568900 RepID=A0A9N8HDB5_9STRA|nr:aarF domain-containing protein kinase 1 [Seminavis robusta]|eukprot:Sro452_g145870.1 aarF domain-containing protein kinase 1 (564) ;mRNA; f:26571-28610
MTMLRTAAKIGTRVAGAGLAAGTGYGFYLYETDEGSERMIKVYWTMVPVVMNYRLLEAKHKLVGTSDEEWVALDDHYAKRTVDKLGSMQGTYVKYCQTAAGFHNMFSEVWIHEFRKLENQVPPRPVETVYETIRKETGKEVEDLFSYFDPVPLGSASIGQVHKAVLKGTGRTVAVKVQYDDAEKLFREDMHTIRNFCNSFAPEHMVTLGALEKQNALEMDYQLEAENLKDVAHNMRKHGLMPREVVVPQPFPELTTRRMLIMEYLQGPKLGDGLRDFFADWATQNGTTLEALEAEARHRIEEEGIPDKYEGESALTISMYRKALQAYNLLVKSSVALYNGSLGWITAPMDCPDPRKIPPNIPRIVDTMMRVHGYQLLADGIFNGDPHGGNFLLLPDGRIGLIDYGATKRLTRNERLSACLLFAAIHRNDEEVLFDMSMTGGYKSKYGNKEVLMKLIQFGYNSWGKEVTGGKNLQQFVDELKEKDPWTDVPDNFVMAQFMSIRLRSLALGMNHPVRCADWWGPMAEEVLKKEGLPYESWDIEQMEKYKPELNMQKHKWGLDRFI